MRSLPSITLLLILAVASSARTLAAQLPEETRAAVDAAIEQFMNDNHVPGLSAAIVVDGRLVYEQGYGLADVENRVRATPKTVYRLASISKMLTAVAVMQLVEAGEIDLAAPIQRYVPDFPEKQAPVTCELLLKHQSGIRHYKPGEVRSTVAYPNIRDSFAVFQNDPLLFTPGEKFSYTTYGYNVLGAAIEGASGRPYVEFVMEHVCRPAGMKTIRPDRQAKIIPHRAAGYRRVGPVLENDLAVDISNKIPGGGWCAAPGDLARFAVALMRGRLVSPLTLERMWIPQKTSTGGQTEAGYGCFIRTVDGERRISHSGGQPKVSTYLSLAPARKSAVAVMCNLRNARVQPLADKLMKLVGNQADK